MNIQSYTFFFFVSIRSIIRHSVYFYLPFRKWPILARLPHTTRVVHQSSTTGHAFIDTSRTIGTVELLIAREQTHTQNQCILRHYKSAVCLFSASVNAFCHFQVCSHSYGCNYWGLYQNQPFRVYTSQRGALTQEEGARQGPACLRDRRTK